LSTDSFQARSELEVGDRRFEIFRLDALQEHFDVARLPFSLKILVENLLRTEGDGAVEAADIEALAGWDAKAEPSKEIAFTPRGGVTRGWASPLRRRASGSPKTSPCSGASHPPPHSTYTPTLSVMQPKRRHDCSSRGPCKET